MTPHAALFLLLGLPGLAHAQSPDPVALTVRVRAEGEPVAGAVVRVGAEQVKADASGQVTLALAPGGHDITVEAPGFVPAVASAVLEAYAFGRQPLEDDPSLVSSPPYVLIGALARRRFGRLLVFINAENLLDVRQTREEPVVLPARRPDGRWLVDAWAPLDGRVINGGVRVFF